MKEQDSGSGQAKPAAKDGGSPVDSLEQANADLLAQNQKLRELNEYRASAISHLSHELRTPLTSILGFSEILLSQEQLTDIQQNFVTRIQKSAQQLQNNLTQLSALARPELPSDDNSSS